MTFVNKNKKKIIILIVIIIVILYYYGIKYFTLQNYNKYIVEYLNGTEADRNKIMKGDNSMKYYVNFSFHYSLFNLFDKFIQKLDEHKINYFLIGGGLIGIFRHNNTFIPWDDDLDIGVLEEDRDKIYKIINDMSQEDDRYFLEEGFIPKIGYDRNNKGNPIQVDLFFYKNFPEQNYYHFSSEKQRFSWKNQYITHNEIFPLNTEVFKLFLPNGDVYKEIKVKIPNKSKEYLHRCYPKWDTNIVINNPHSNYYRYLILTPKTFYETFIRNFEKLFLLKIIDFYYKSKK